MPAKPPAPPATNPVIEVLTPAEQTAAAKINPFDLEIGPPFALAQGCELLQRDDAAGMPGTYAAIRCQCGATWRANLLSDDDKICPQCGAAFTHVFVFCPVSERGMLAAILEEILQAHGLMPDDDQNDEGDDDEDDEDDDEDDDDHAAENEAGDENNDDPT